jgi:hypothetical protein
VTNVPEEFFGRRWPVKNVENSSIHDRLEAGRISLEHLDGERAMSGDAKYGRAVEKRIVGRELFELELQDFDEQIERICESARVLCGDFAGSSAASPTKPSQPHLL